MVAGINASGRDPPWLRLLLLLADLPGPESVDGLVWVTPPEREDDPVVAEGALEVRLLDGFDTRLLRPGARGGSVVGTA